MAIKLENIGLIALCIIIFNEENDIIGSRGKFCPIASNAIHLINLKKSCADGLRGLSGEMSILEVNRLLRLQKHRNVVAQKYLKL